MPDPALHPLVSVNWLGLALYLALTAAIAICGALLSRPKHFPVSRTVAAMRGLLLLWLLLPLATEFQRYRFLMLGGLMTDAGAQIQGSLLFELRDPAMFVCLWTFPMLAAALWVVDLTALVRRGQVLLRAIFSLATLAVTFGIFNRYWYHLLQ